jgi:glycine/D-amino acid oxidase-like deaminating enzyme
MIQPLRRREVLKGIGAGALLAAAGGCVTTPRTPPTNYARSYSHNPFVAPDVSMDNVIRVIVGHRPYRPAGFRVEREQFDAKTVVHNYGHGGGGISLAWGSSALAVRETLGQTPTKAAVIGSGIIGLTSARLLQDTGWQVTLYTREVARHTTSNIAVGEWSPFSAHDPAVSSDDFKRKLQWAARVSHHAYTNLGGADYGVRWLENYELDDSPESTGVNLQFKDLFPHQATLGPGEHPFPTRYAHRFLTMQFDPGILLRRLVQDFQLAGGRLVIRNFSDRSEVLSLDESFIFNCTGLGAAQLFGDETLTPIKGQLVFLPPDPAVDYATLGGGKGFLHMFPRTDVILLGGIYRIGDGSRNVEPEETERIVTEHQRLFASFG